MKNEKDGVPGASRLQNAFWLGKKEGRVCLVSAKNLATSNFFLSSATVGNNNLHACFHMIRQITD